jgi:type II secretory pathway predicted ATPase ExeA
MDYLEYYGLKEHPFSNVVDGRFYYNGTLHSDALVKLKYAVDTRKGLAVVIGGIGTGKTTLARKFLEELDESEYEALWSFTQASVPNGSLKNLRCSLV